MTAHFLVIGGVYKVCCDAKVAYKRIWIVFLWDSWYAVALAAMHSRFRKMLWEGMLLCILAWCTDKCMECVIFLGKTTSNHSRRLSCVFVGMDCISSRLCGRREGPKGSGLFWTNARQGHPSKQIDLCVHAESLRYEISRQGLLEHHVVLGWFSHMPSAALFSRHKVSREPLFL